MDIRDAKWFIYIRMPFYRSIVCPRSSDPFLYSKLLQKTGHYVLNVQYLYNSIDIRTIPGTMNTLSWKPGYIYDIYQNVCQQSCCNCCVASWIMFKHMNHVQQTYTGVDWERCTFHTECSIITYMSGPWNLCTQKKVT